jgi:hypothetical protein
MIHVKLKKQQVDYLQGFTRLYLNQYMMQGASLCISAVHGVLAAKNY